MNLPLNTDLTGKVAVVTGAAGTLCSVFSKALAASGAKVALLGRTYANVQKLADEIAAEGGTAKAYECNVLDKAAVMACHEQVLADFGPCDILLNGAGGNHPSATTDKEYYEPGDLDADTKARLAQGERIVEILKQDRNSPVPVEKQVAILYATIHDYLVNVKVPDVAEYEKSLYEYLDNDAAGAAVMDTIRTTGNLDKDTEEQLKTVLTRYTESFVKAH